jgi:hypothetical protein
MLWWSAPNVSIQEFYIVWTLQSLFHFELDFTYHCFSCGIHFSQHQQMNRLFFLYKIIFITIIKNYLTTFKSEVFLSSPLYFMNICLSSGQYHTVSWDLLNKAALSILAHIFVWACMSIRCLAVKHTSVC